MAKLKIIRPRQLSNRGREITIYLDGQKLGNILNGETKEYEILYGQHTINATIDWFWCGSRNFLITINENETNSVIISPYKYSDYLISFCIFLTFLHFILQDELKTILDSLVLIAVIPIYLITLYYLTFRRKDFISLKQLT